MPFDFYKNQVSLCNFAETVDRILDDEDKDEDGYLTYSEYANSRRTTRMLKHAGKNLERKQEQQ